MIIRIGVVRSSSKFDIVITVSANMNGRARGRSKCYEDLGLNLRSRT